MSSESPAARMNITGKKHSGFECTRTVKSFFPSPFIKLPVRSPVASDVNAWTMIPFVHVRSHLP